MMVEGAILPGPDMGGVAGQGSDAPAMSAEQRELWQQFVGGGWVLYRALFREIDQSAPLSSADWRLLEVLASAPQLRISDLADATQIGLSTVSRQVSRFLERGYAVRVESVDVDARQKWVQITDKGTEMVRPILEARDRAVRRLVIDRLTPDQFEQLCTIFGLLGERIVEHED
ncbi:MarR family winged helix-turn-helix transcriptional regulator [Gordonia neofelifaecis]|uniref:Regulatory protein MarR n=1 Tax=Gordonia neofelifaecis NRRL B-59395 TaxID=644548 RepID=F1YPA4_9ACTN|nr:MarR family transcriptional regulator [Gordonia neofelifaecis]EGD53499.1 regulatory protein MarR [Gordonia neofelifaecis NRRL B-59395]